MARIAVLNWIQPATSLVHLPGLCKLSVDEFKFNNFRANKGEVKTPMSLDIFKKKVLLNKRFECFSRSNYTPNAIIIIVSIINKLSK